MFLVGSIGGISELIGTVVEGSGVGGSGVGEEAEPRNLWTEETGSPAQKRRDSTLPKMIATFTHDG